MSSHRFITTQARPHRKLGLIDIIFKSKQVGSDLDRVPVHQVKRFMGIFCGYLGVAIVLEYGCLEFAAVCLGEVNHWLDWHLVLHAADDNVVRELAEPLEIDLLVCGKKR